MGWRLGMNIAKRQTQIVFKNNVGRYLSIDDAFENRHLMGSGSKSHVGWSRRHYQKRPGNSNNTHTRYPVSHWFG